MQTGLSRKTCNIANLFFLGPIVQKVGDKFGNFLTSSSFMYWEWLNVGPVLGDLGIS